MILIDEQGIVTKYNDIAVKGITHAHAHCRNDVDDTTVVVIRNTSFGPSPFFLITSRA